MSAGKRDFLPKHAGSRPFALALNELFKILDMESDQSRFALAQFHGREARFFAIAMLPNPGLTHM